MNQSMLHKDEPALNDRKRDDELLAGSKVTLESSTAPCDGEQHHSVGHLVEGK